MIEILFSYFTKGRVVMKQTRSEIVKQLVDRTDWEATFISFSAAYFISNRISPYFSYHFIRKGTIPNKITVYMIVSGVLGSLFFMIPAIWAKIIGAVLIHLWFILDCSDGEVARYTKKFSKFGTELDYLAHIIDHPFFCAAFIFSLIQLDQYPKMLILILVFCSLFLDSTIRNLITLEKYTDIKKNTNTTIVDRKLSLYKVLKSIFNTFLFFPNVVLWGVLVYFIDYFFGTHFLVALLVGNCLSSLLIVGIKLKRKLFQFYRS